MNSKVKIDYKRDEKSDEEDYLKKYEEEESKLLLKP